MRIDIITLFPEMFTALKHGIPGRAQKQELIEIKLWNPRDFTNDPHRTVDDRPYGGGPGMVMKVEPLYQAIATAKQDSAISTLVSYLSPQGRVFNQDAALELTKRERLLLVAGRYEGIDERLLQTSVDEEWSIGNFVISGGELAAMCMIDAVVRLLPGALGDPESATQDSFMNGLLDHPHYTRPELFQTLKVPEVLLSGDHQAIQRWRLKQALGHTWKKRPDLLETRVLNEQEQVLLAEFIQEHEKSLS